MKTIRLFVAVCAVLMIAAPAMALDVEISGHYFLEAYNNSNENLSKDDSTNDYGSMEFMAKPVFKVNDNITITTQFTALEDHVWGENPVDSETDDDYQNFEWKAAYMTIKTPIGGFVAGRYINTPWGSGLGDTSASRGSNSDHVDRLMWVVPTGDFIFALVAQKNVEGDKGTIIDDQDFERFYAAAAYKQENWSTGLLLSYYNIKNFVTQKTLREYQTNGNAYLSAVDTAETLKVVYDGTRAATLAAVGGSQALTNLTEETPGTALFEAKTNLDSANGAVALLAGELAGGLERTEAGIFLFDPYFRGTFGPLSIDTELIYGTGTIDLNGFETDPVTGATFDEVDASALLATIDLKYDIAAFTFNAGYTYVQGDSDYSDDETNAAGYLEPSKDLKHGFLLTSDDSGLENSLGGTDARGIALGNVAGGQETLTATAGYQMYWLGAKYRLLENLQLGLLYVKSKADDPPYFNLDPTAGPIDKRQWDDDHGEEYDFTIEWDIMDNLTFKGVVAHLATGDYWKKGDPTADIEDNTTFYGRVIVEF